MKKQLILAAALLTAGQSVMGQPGTNSRISDDYAKAALRILFYVQSTRYTIDGHAALVDEADVQATTQTENDNLALIRKLEELQASPDCYKALRLSLKARDGEIPASCK